MRRHLDDLASTYGQQVFVSLINHKGHEKPIKEAYERHMSEVSSLPYHFMPEIIVPFRSRTRRFITSTSTSTPSVAKCAGTGSVF